MIVSRKKSIPDLCIQINGCHLDQCDSYKYLGIYIDKNLNWKSHIEYTCQKVSKVCGALAKIRHSVNIDILKNVYHALLYSYLRYGIIVWGNAAKATLEPLEILVNKAIRIMAFIPNGNFDLSQVYKDLKLLDLPSIHKLETAKYMYKSEKSLLPVSLGKYFEIDRCAEEHSHSTRHQALVNIPDRIAPRLKSRTKIAEKSIQFVGSTLWSHLPDDLKNSESFTIFKRLYKNNLLELPGNNQ